MSIYRFKYLFHQFVNKKATPAEAEEFLKMLRENNYDEETQVLLDEFWNQSASSTPLAKEKAERIFNKVMTSTSIEEPVPIYRSHAFWVKAAAAILIIGLSALFYQREAEPTHQVAKTDHIKAAQAVKPGRRFISLPDGSTVTLNVNSSLVLGKEFMDNGRREVYLEGEAYFDIAHDAENPFIVYTGKLKTTVLGTAFNIKSSTADSKVTVTVTRGKVEVGDDKSTYNILVPNEQIVVDQNQSKHQKRPVKAEEVVAWKNEDIYFDDVSMKDVAKQLEDRFDVSIVFSNEVIKKCRFSATFLKTQTLGQILNVIGEFNNLEYKFDGNQTVILDGPGCR